MRWRDTETLFNYTLRHNPNSLAAYQALASDAYERGDRAETLSFARLGLTARPGDPALLQWVGNIALESGRFEEAVAAYSEGAKSSGWRIEHLNGLGCALAHLARLDEAEAALEEAIRIAPDYAVGHQNLGIVCAQRQKWDRAVIHLTRALKLDPDLPQAKSLLPQATAMRDRAPASQSILPASRRGE